MSNFKNPSTTPSGRKETFPEEEEEDKKCLGVCQANNNSIMIPTAVTAQ